MAGSVRFGAFLIGFYFRFEYPEAARRTLPSPPSSVPFNWSILGTNIICFYASYGILAGQLSPGSFSLASVAAADTRPLARPSLSLIFFHFPRRKTTLLLDRKNCRPPWCLIKVLLRSYKKFAKRRGNSLRWNFLNARQLDRVRPLCVESLTQIYFDIVELIIL